MKLTSSNIFGRKLTLLGILLFLFILKPVLAENLEIEASGFLEWNQQNKTYSANENAMATQGDRTIKADEIIAFYESEEDRSITRIEAKGSVTFQDGVDSGYTDNLVYTTQTQTIILSGSKNYLESEQFTAESASKIEFFQVEGKLSLLNKAVISLSDNREIQAEQIDLELIEGNQIKSMNARGNVKLTEESGRIAYANSAVYNAETEDTTLTDSVEIIDGDNLLRGEKAIINMVSGYSKILAGGENKRVTGKLILNTSN